MAESPHTPASTAVTSRIGLGEKLAYVLANIGNIPVMVTLSTFLLLFYTDVVGLDPVAIGTLFLIARVLDGVSDPIMGYIIDHLPPTRLGRFRGYLILGALLTSLNFALVFLGPSLAPAGKLAIAYVSYLLLGWLFDLMDIPLNSMLAVMTDDDGQRSTLSTLKGITYTVGAVVVTAAVLPIIDMFPIRQEGFHVVIVAIAVLVAVFSVVGALGIRERVFPIHGEESYKIRDIVKILGAKAVLSLFATTILQQVGAGVASGIGVFFYLYVLKRPDLYPLAALAFLVGAVVAVLVVKPMLHRLGKKVTVAIALSISALGGLIALLLPANQPMLFIALSMITAPGVGLFMLISYAVQADNMDYVEWKLGFRAEAAVSSMNSFIVKAGSGVGAAIGAYSLAAIGYVANAPEQSAGTIRGLYLINFGVPGILGVVAVAIWLLTYPLTRARLAEMKSDLAERRAERGMDVPETVSASA